MIWRLRRARTRRLPSSLVRSFLAPRSSVQTAARAFGALALLTLLAAPGTHWGQIYVPASEPDVTLAGATGNPRDVTLVDDIAHGTVAANGNQYGTDCSATLSVAGNGFAAYGITVQNSFDPAANPQITSPQAVDFLCGSGTAVFDHDTIDILGHPGGTVSAPDTGLEQPYGFLITNSRIINRPGNLAAASYYLGRPWRHTGVTSPVGQITIRDTYLPAAINPEQWQNWTSAPCPLQDARFYENQNTGPGSAVNADVPQLTAAQATQYTVASYLGGWWPK
jgi:pectin methylesterase-like acyl-CoA thioesterase